MEKKQIKEPGYLDIKATDIIDSLRTNVSDLEYKNMLLNIQLKQAVNKINGLQKKLKESD